MRSIHRPSLSRPFLELRSMWRLWYENALGFVSWECGDVWSCSLSPSARLATSHEFFFFAYSSYICDSHCDLNSCLKKHLWACTYLLCVFGFTRLKPLFCHLPIHHAVEADFDVRFSSSEVCRVMNIAWFCVAVFLEMPPGWICLDHLTVFSKVHLGHCCSFNLVGVILSTHLL